MGSYLCIYRYIPGYIHVHGLATKERAVLSKGEAVCTSVVNKRFQLPLPIELYLWPHARIIPLSQKGSASPLSSPHGTAVSLECH